MTWRKLQTVLCRVIRCLDEEIYLVPADITRESAGSYVLNAKGIQKIEYFSLSSNEFDSPGAKRSFDSIELFNNCPLLLRPELISSDAKKPKFTNSINNNSVLLTKVNLKAGSSYSEAVSLLNGYIGSRMK